MKRITNSFLFLGILLCILQVWLPSYYLTGDGPCHLYNAQILHDMWCHQHNAFYSVYYTLVYQPNPNWLSSITMALLLFLVHGILAEKIFLTIYILFFTSGFYLLLKKITNDPFWPLVLLLFVFPHTLAKGFYNFSFSIAFYFWMVWAWLRFLDKKNLANALLSFVFTALLFFTHLLAFIFGAFTCAALVASYAIAIGGGIKHFFSRFLLTASLWLFALLLPFVILMKWFTGKEGGMRIQLKPHFYRLIELAEFKYLINITHTEDFFAVFTGLILLLLFGMCFLRFRKNFSIHKYDGFILSLAFALFVYLLFPESFMGRLILINMRVQPFIYILVGCCIAYRFPSGIISKNEFLKIISLYFIPSVAIIAYLLHIYPGTIDASSAEGRHILILGMAIIAVLLFISCSFFFRLSFEKIRNAGLLLLAASFICLSVIRLSCMLRVSKATTDLLSASSYIQPGKVILPLDFSPEGINTSGEKIADRNFLFIHAADYIGTQNPEIILDNYEANMGYFPVNWQKNINPYNLLSKQQGIEAIPPYAQISDYKKTTGVTVDYILMWCYNPSFLKDAYFQQLYSEIQSGYHIIYTSPSGRSILYAANDMKK